MSQCGLCSAKKRLHMGRITNFSYLDPGQKFSAILGLNCPEGGIQGGMKCLL